MSCRFSDLWGVSRRLRIFTILTRSNSDALYTQSRSLKSYLIRTSA